MANKNKTNFDDLLDQALVNVETDRDKTKELLDDLVQYVIKGADRHKECGLILAKYLETLQRSNEQIVKIAAIIHKDTTKNETLSDEERDNVFEQLNKKK